MIDEKRLIKYLIECQEKDIECQEKDEDEKEKDFLEDMIWLISEQPQVGGWIPVTERLPDKTQDECYPMSLVTLDNGDVCLGVYRYDDEEWWTRMSVGETVYTKDHKVTAWMPLPEPFKESEEE